ncbi:hypothetical protein [Bacillus sp. JJ722]|uniref:hypothetical protein n=1 Tax=Bacillus sp. JJ722 TaxID=3122973 RepID=UPI002FFD9B0E
MKVNQLGSSYNQLIQQKEKTQVAFNFKDFILTDEEKMKEKKGRLEVRREDGYIRQYIILSDGSKKLISEAKETEFNSLNLNKNADTTNQNNKQSNATELMQLLNQTIINNNNFAPSFKVSKTTTD